MSRESILENYKKYSNNAIAHNIGCDEWAEKRRRIKPPGWSVYEYYDFSKAPYLRRPCQLVSKNSPAKMITVVKGSRLGFTEGFILNSIFYNIDINHVPMYYVSADQKLLDEYTKLKLLPMLKESGLQNKIRPSSVNEKSKTKRSGENSQLLEFGDSYLKLCGANNANNFRQLGAQYVYLDERATYPIFANEGDAGDLAIGRTGDFSRYSKIIQVSTPTLCGSKLETDYNSGTMEKYFVKCPECGCEQTFEFAELTNKDENGERKLITGLHFKHENYQLKSDVKYKCKGCGRLLPETLKYKMLESGRWISQQETNNNYSFHISSLYSNFETWENVVDTFLKAKREGTPSALQTFKNLELGEFFEYKSKKIEIRDIITNNSVNSGYRRNEVPDDVAFLTAAADVQGDRIEVEIKGWSTFKNSYSIEYLILQGDTKLNEVWDKFEELILTQKWGGLFPAIYFIDEGDGNSTQIVRDFCMRLNTKESKRTNTNVTVALPLKGASQNQIAGKPYSLFIPKIDPNTKKSYTNLKVLRVNTYYYKELLMTWLELKKTDKDDRPFGFCNFPVDYPEKYFKQLTSEKLSINLDKQGYEKKKWEKKQTGNEALDLATYNIAICDYVIEQVYAPLFQKSGMMYDYNFIVNHLIMKRLEKKA